MEYRLAVEYTEHGPLNYNGFSSYFVEYRIFWGDLKTSLVKDFNSGSPSTYRFGEIETNNEQESQQFVKVDAGTDVKELIEELKQKWDLDHPNLLISVIGGAWNFPVNNSVREVFRKGIIKATVGTKAWILTSGTNVGAAKYVAEAVQQSKLVTRESQTTDVVTIGITSWNTLHGEQRGALEQALGEKPSATATTTTSGSDDLKLDPNHTHFIFVHDKSADSSTSFAEQVKATSDLRLQFETEMCNYMLVATDSDIDDVILEIDSADQPKLFKGLGSSNDQTIEKSDDGVAVLKKWKRDNGKDATRSVLLRAVKKCNVQVGKKIQCKWKDGPVPVVCMYIEGGRATLTHACIAVENDLPIVAVNHSGRAANVLSLAFKSDGLKSENEILKSKLGNLLSNDDDKISERLTTGLKDKHHLWNVYEEHTGLEIDQVILKALMKAYRDDSRRQLSLAQTWNRYDLVKRELFTTMVESMDWDDYNAEAEYFEGILHTALVNDQPGFVKLFLDNGVIPLKEYVTKKELQSLYNTVPDSPLRELMKGKERQETDLKHVGKTLQKLTISEFSIYNSNVDTKQTSDKDALGDPYKHLFLYAVFNKFHEMAEYFWEEGEEHIAAALVAVNMYKNMASIFEDEKEELMEQARKYENLAGEILSDCESDMTGEDVQNLLLRTLDNWGGVTCLKLADAAQSRNFLALRAVQSLTRNVWIKGLPEKKTESSYSSTAPPAKGFRVSPVAPQTQNGHSANEKHSQVKHKQPTDTGLIKYHKPKRIHYWLFSPRSKSFQFTLSYLAFLALYSYVLLMDQLSSQTQSWWEWLFIVWGWTLAIEEIRQMAQSIMNGRLKEYLWEYWNQIDLLMSTVFVIASILLFPRQTRETARILLALDLFLFYFRLLHAFTLSRTIGPKVLMIFKMFADLGAFLGILFVILVGYGIAMQAILYPQIHDTVSLLQGILYRPYFQIYGELFLDDIYAPDDSCSSNQSEIAIGASPCPQNSGLGITFLALYMMLSNVLLLNLLIAMFGDTFSKVQEETDCLWKYHFYSLTKEYLERPVLIPPFIIFEHAYRLCRLVFQRAGLLNWNRNGMQLHFSQAESRRLVHLEENAAYNYVIRKRRREHKEACSCFHQTETSKRRILDRLNEFDEMQTYRD